VVLSGVCMGRLSNTMINLRLTGVLGCAVKTPYGGEWCDSLWRKASRPALSTQISAFCALYLSGWNYRKKSVFRHVLKISKSDSYFVMSHPPSDRSFVWKNSAPTGRIFMKFDILSVFRKCVRKIQVSLKSDKNIGYFARSIMSIYDNISRNSS
jgi:hypothetical protein